MNKYVTKSGQNIYDIALVLYGSIEGVFDLLISNPSISFDTIFNTGMEVYYHSDFVVNQDIVNWLDTNNIKVKNGQCEIGNIDVRSEIEQWVTKSNDQIRSLYLDGTLKIVSTLDESSTIKAFDWDILDEPLVAALGIASSNSAMSNSFAANTELTPISPQDNWQTQYIDKQNVSAINSKKWDFIETLTGTNLEIMDEKNQMVNLNTMYSNGMIIVPSDNADKEAYYSNAATPKLLIQQSSTNVAINMQICSNCFVAFDWGDNSSLDFYHYTDSTIKATHTYSDSGEHTIKMYGHTNFTNLDLSKVNGIYYALSEIYISKDFITNYPNAKTLNKLFITKNAQ